MILQGWRHDLTRAGRTRENDKAVIQQAGLPSRTPIKDLYFYLSRKGFGLSGVNLQAYKVRLPTVAERTPRSTTWGMNETIFYRIGIGQGNDQAN